MREDAAIPLRIVANNTLKLDQQDIAIQLENQPQPFREFVVTRKRDGKIVGHVVGDSRSESGGRVISETVRLDFDFSRKE